MVVCGERRSVLRRICGSYQYEREMMLGAVLRDPGYCYTITVAL